MKQIVPAYQLSIFPLFALHGSLLQSGLKVYRLVCFKLLIGCLITSGLFSQMVQAQNLDSLAAIQNHNHKKLGVVLSGGGAKGLAHIGVLKLIEEAGIKIDYIGGTSMGAIIGGLYAAGYNAHQLDSIFQQTDYEAIVRDFMPRIAKNFYQKENDERYAFTLPYKNFKLTVPSSLSKGLYNYNLINRLTYHVKDISNFNELPIPFLCVATNIETGQEVVLREGNLTQAVLASGAFPTLYAPVEINEHYLVDGGVLNNFPAKHVKNMGADIIIGIDVQDGLRKREDLQEATRILVQISNMQVKEQTKYNIAYTDIYIQPDIDGFSVISFDKGKDIIRKGEEAGQKFWDDFKQISQKYNTPKLTQTYQLNDTIQLKEIYYNQLKNYTRRYIIGKLRFNECQTITFQDLNRGIENLNATENFKTISYQLQKDENGEGQNLILNLTENPQKTYLKFGLHYNNVFKSGILINYTHKNTLFKNDVLSLDAILGDNPRYVFDYYIDNGFYWSFGIKSRYIRFNRNFSANIISPDLITNNNINNLNITLTDFTNQVYFQTLFLQKFISGVGLELKHLTINSQTLNPNNVIDNSDYISLFGYIKFDSYDSKYFPKKGFLFDGHYQQIFDQNTPLDVFGKTSFVRGKLGYVTTVFQKFSLTLGSELGFTFGESQTPALNYALGGFGFYEFNNIRPFLGYDFGSLIANSYITGDVSLDYEFMKNHHLNFTANYANLGTNIFLDTTWFSLPQYSGYGVGYGFDSVLGPIQFKHAWSPETKKHYNWFSIGYTF